MTACSRGALFLVLALASRAPQAAEWTPSSTELAKLRQGEVLISTDSDRDMEPGDVRAVVQIAASAEQVFRTMTSCDLALRFVPRLKQCKVVETADDGSWQVVEHDVAGNGLIPHTRYVFRADYEPFQRIRCTEVSGDFRENRGLWTFRTLKDSKATLVTYTVHVVPRFYAPRWVVRANLKRELPPLMVALRDVTQASLDPIAGVVAPTGVGEPAGLRP